MNMRVLLAVLLVVMLPACTSILLGDASTSERGLSTDTRSSAQVAEDNAISATIRRKLSADSTVNQYAVFRRGIAPCRLPAILMG
jgi:hypothetical protein